MLVESKTESNKLELRHQLSTNMPELFNTTTNIFQQLILYIYLIYNVVVKSLPVGTMTIYMNATGQFSDVLSRLFGVWLDLARNSLDVLEMIDFFDIPSQQYNAGNLTPVFDENSTIEFKNIWFKYPGNDRYVLKDMNITIKGNEKLCIVGANGSGKSTFVKLLLRLYFPTKGEILLNGININEYDYFTYQRLFAPVFQDFVKYSFTLGTSIVLASKFDKKRLDDVCFKSGLSPLINKLPKGYDTQVDKYVDEEGFDPSGGEAQRIAIARAVYHDGMIFLLDEPTAALDPIAEYEIYTQFNEMVTNRCALFITHRLSAVQLSDKVAVFEDGSVIEYGTHKNLYKKNGVYTEMFDKQAEFYRETNK